MRHLRKLWIVAVLLLSACGSGNDEAGPSAERLKGIYTGALEIPDLGSANLVGFIRRTGAAYFFLTGADEQSVILAGSIGEIGDAVSGSMGAYLANRVSNFNYYGPIDDGFAPIDGEVVEDEESLTITGNAYDDAREPLFGYELSYVPEASETAASLGAIAGTWGAIDGVHSASVTINPTGQFTGVVDDCDYTGTVSPPDGVNVYGFTMSITCAPATAQNFTGALSLIEGQLLLFYSNASFGGVLALGADT